MSAISDALDQMAAVYQQLGLSTSLYGVVLEHGHEYEAQPLPGFARGEPKQCFQNALDIADDDQVLYVEGYLMRPEFQLLIHHAWCTDPDDLVVIDPTIADPENCCYYGIGFQAHWVIGLGYTGMALERFAAHPGDDSNFYHAVIE